MAKQDDPSSQPDWQGLKELDRAISENRLTAYSWKKAWADPGARAIVLAASALLGGFAVFVIVQDLIL